MSIDKLADTMTNRAGGDQAQPPPVGIRERLDTYEEQIARALPDGVDPVTFIAAAATDVRYNADLLDISRDPDRVGSIMGAVFTAAQLGLPFGRTTGYAWMIPRWDRQTANRLGRDRAMVAVFQLGYKGLIALARRTGKVGTIVAGECLVDEIREHRRSIVNGQFVQTLDIVENLTGRPMPPDQVPASFEAIEAGEGLHRPDRVYYVQVEMIDGSSSWFHTMSESEMFRHYCETHPTPSENYGGRVNAAGRTPGSWDGHYHVMAAISCWRGGSRFLDLSTELDRALANHGALRTITAPDKVDLSTIDQPLHEIDAPDGEDDGDDAPAIETAAVETEPEPVVAPHEDDATVVEFADASGVDIGRNRKAASIIPLLVGPLGAPDLAAVKARIDEWATVPTEDGDQ